MALSILGTLKKKVNVGHMIHRRLAGMEPPRAHGTIHASELMKEKEFCPREWALLDLGFGKKKAEFLGTCMRITFDHGRDMEYRLRNEWLRDVVVGNWECGVCGNDYGKFGKAPKIDCPKCGYKRWEYKEVRLLDPVSGVSGGVDVFVDVGETKLRLVEVKSMDKDMHKALSAPLAEHKFRTSLYLKLAEASEYDASTRINTDEATILYVSKSYGFKDLSLKEAGIEDDPFSPFKEFPIKRDDSLLVTPLNKATALTKWRVSQAVGAAPLGLPCGVCPNALQKRSQQCPVVYQCFSGQFASEITWMEAGKVRHEGKKVVVGK